MTTTTDPDTDASTDTDTSADPHPRLRAALATAAVVACLPYLLLKAAWLAGSDVGVADPQLLHSASLQTANVATAAMELIALASAVVLATRHAARVPGRLLALICFAGAGLLGGILLLIPVQAAMRLTGALPEVPAAAGADPIRSWVYLMVYGGFTVLGVALTGLLGLESWRRWVAPLGLTRPIGTWCRSTRRRVVLAVTAAAALLVASGSETAIAWHAGELGGHQVMSPLAATAAAASLVALAGRGPGRLSGAPLLVAAWTGSAAVAAWGLYFALLIAVPNPLRGDTSVPAGLLAAELARGAAGVLAAMVASCWVTGSPGTARERLVRCDGRRRPR